jgi:hypothetical protein
MRSDAQTGGAKKNAKQVHDSEKENHLIED